MCQLNALSAESVREAVIEGRRGIDEDTASLLLLHDLGDFILNLRGKAVSETSVKGTRDTSRSEKPRLRGNGTKHWIGEQGSTDLHVLQRVLLRDAAQNILFAALLQFSCQQELVQNVIGLGEGEDDVELADVAVVLVHLFDVSVDDLERDQFVVVRGAAGDEEQRGISAVDNFGVWRRESATRGLEHRGGGAHPCTRGSCTSESASPGRAVRHP